jgi:hypothetical protein
MRVDAVTDSQVKTIIRDTITNCGGTPKEIELDLCSTMVEDAVGKAVAGRCVEIATATVPIPDGQRNRTWEEISHAIMRELLGWAGM